MMAGGQMTGERSARSHTSGLHGTSIGALRAGLLATLALGALTTAAPLLDATAQGADSMAGMSMAGMPPLSEAPAPDVPKTPPAFDYWQPEWMMRELWGPDRMSKGMRVRMQRHQTFMDKGAPAEYAGQHAMIPPTPSTLDEGRDLYVKHCTSCHGGDGMGDGNAANALSPSPALLAFMIRRPIAVDEYLLWSIAEGGAAFGSEMPAFKDKLQRDEIWKIVTYMRAGFPGSKVDRPR